MDISLGLRSLLFVGGFVISSCALIDTYVDAPGVDIERIATTTGSIASASFMEDRYGFYLRGSVRPRSINKMPLSGHIDIAITGPDGASTKCMTTRHRNPPRKVRRPFFVRFEKLPEPGSVVRVWHHGGAIHNGCVT